MTIDALKASKLGKIIVKLVKEPPAPGERCLSVTPASSGDVHMSVPALKRAHLSYHNLSENHHVSNNRLFVIVLPQRSRIWRRI